MFTCSFCKARQAKQKFENKKNHATKGQRDQIQKTKLWKWHEPNKNKLFQSLYRAVMMHSSGLDQLRRSLQLDVEGLNKNLGSLDSRLDKQRFFEANNSSFMIPKKFEYTHSFMKFCSLKRSPMAYQQNLKGENGKNSGMQWWIFCELVWSDSKTIREITACYSKSKYIKKGLWHEYQGISKSDCFAKVSPWSGTFQF